MSIIRTVKIIRGLAMVQLEKTSAKPEDNSTVDNWKLQSKNKGTKVDDFNLLVVSRLKMVNLWDVSNTESSTKQETARGQGTNKQNAALSFKV